MPASNACCLQPKKPLRAGTDLETIYENLLKDGACVRAPGAPQRPPVVVAFDTQCPWCTRLLEAAEPLLAEADFRWYPVAVLSTESVLQAETILSAPDPWDAFLAHERLFAAGKGSGLPVSGLPADRTYERRVWNNSKIFRRAGGTVVPLGAVRTADGRLLPIVARCTTEELRSFIFDGVDVTAPASGC